MARSASPVARKTAYVDSDGTSRTVLPCHEPRRLGDAGPELRRREHLQVGAVAKHLPVRHLEALEHERALSTRAAREHLDARPALLEVARPLLPVAAELEAVRPHAALLKRANGDDAGHAVHAHPRGAAGDEVPGARLEDEPERVDRALHDAVALAVADARAAAAPDRGGESGEVRDAVLGAEPAAGVEVEHALGAGGALLELGRKRGQQLQPCGRELAAEAELGRGSGHAGGEERLGLVAGQAGEARPVPAREPVA